jgi:hypothetical protein
MARETRRFGVPKLRMNFVRGLRFRLAVSYVAFFALLLAVITLVRDVVGLGSAVWDVWFGFVAPPKTPKPIADRLITELTAVLNDPEAIVRVAA